MPSITCLFGNGLSVSYNQELSVASLTQSLLNEFSDLSGNKAANFLAQFARELQAKEGADFETLLGPLESFSRAVPYLSGMATLTSQSTHQVRRCGRQLARFAREIHQVGIGVVLDHISEQSKGVGKGFDQTIMAVCRQLLLAARLDEDRDSMLTIATLNYDGLLPAALTKLHQSSQCTLRDLGDGRASSWLKASDSHSELESYRIRTIDDLGGNVNLIHLHGSLGWLVNEHTEEVWKFSIPDLRRQKYWSELINGQELLTPKVVLADRKTRVVSDWPFSLAYSMFENRLLRSDIWFIGGYGFGDRPVNTILERAYKKARISAQINEIEPPIIYIVDLRTDIMDQARRIFPDSLPYCDLWVDQNGFPEAVHDRMFSCIFGL